MSFTMSLGREDASSAYCKMWTFWKTEHFMLKSPRAAYTDVTPCSVHRPIAPTRVRAAGGTALPLVGSCVHSGCRQSCNHGGIKEGSLASLGAQRRSPLESYVRAVFDGHKLSVTQLRVVKRPTSKLWY